jgi:hypothetical protein
MTVFRYSAAAVVSFSLIAGCSKQPTGEAAASLTLLQEVNDMLRQATASGRPTKAADLDRYKSNYPRGYEAVKSGEVVVLWATPLQGEGEVGKDELLLAYEKAVPTDGGFVLLSAGTVKKVSASEFSGLPKSGKN